MRNCMTHVPNEPGVYKFVRLGEQYRFLNMNTPEGLWFNHSDVVEEEERDQVVSAGTITIRPTGTFFYSNMSSMTFKKCVAADDDKRLHALLGIRYSGRWESL